VATTHLFDLDDDGGVRGRGLMVRCGHSVEQTELAVAALAVHPLRRGSARDAHLCTDVSDWALLTSLDQSTSTHDRQRRVVVTRHAHATGRRPRSAKTFFAVNVALTARGNPQ